VFEHILISTSFYLLPVFSTAFIALAGGLYFASAMIIGICFTISPIRLLSLGRSSPLNGFLHGVVLYLPLLYLFMILDRINPMTHG